MLLYQNIATLAPVYQNAQFFKIFTKEHTPEPLYHAIYTLLRVSARYNHLSSSLLHRKKTKNRHADTHVKYRSYTQTHT